MRLARPVGRVPSRRHHGAESRLARTPNYNFEKRRKELERKAKKDAKREERQRRREHGEDPSAELPDGTPVDPDAADDLPPPAA